MKPHYEASEDGRYVVREYDRHENRWFDVFTGTEDEALARWNEKTENGTLWTKYEDGRYYAVFPAHTVMLRSTEYEVRHGRSYTMDDF